MSEIYAILGGSGLNEFSELGEVKSCDNSTPFGKASSGLVSGKINQAPIYFMPRHGRGHKLAPHSINYRANIYRLKELGVTRIIAINAVGGIAEFSKPGSLIIPDQIIDYSYDRKHTFYDSELVKLKEHAESVGQPWLLSSPLDHIDFTYPFSPIFRNQMLEHLRSVTLRDPSVFYDGAATYGCTQGPRLESAAEILRLKNDGCDLVGMTVMPEAALARELSIEYLSICISVNWAAGLSSTEITIENIIDQLDCSMSDVKKICTSFISKA